MAVMVSRVLFCLVCVLCSLLIQTVWAEICTSYVDTNGNQHRGQQCGNYYCCGNCYQRSCCSDRSYRISQEDQQRCSKGSGHGKSKLGTLLGSILGSIFPIILCVGVVICCMAPCCLFYKKCRKGRSRGSQAPPTMISGPQLPFPPSNNYPSHPGGYHSVPGQPGFGGLPNPSAPPPYMGGNNPPHGQGGFNPGMPMVNFIGPPLESAPPSNDNAPLPYNPAYS
ncbi:protein shisa-4-like [Epinephelus moara]|uniref:protein shisa-4-like n=1 Tax=Epinephelus moara TaxID=300413 RepID=UPI00214E34DB|nr:protein shisa-4-like [Epinephelus moara]